MSQNSDFVIKKGILNQYTGAGGDVVIPDNVTSIGINAFRDCSSLTSIAIPDGITSIGDCAFKGCSSLTSIAIPDSVTSIGFLSTFRDCSSLISIRIPEGVTCIGESAFKGCKNLTSIILPDSVRVISKGAFELCSALKGITIPRGVIRVGESAFAYCESLTSINIPEGVESIYDCTFEGCSSLTSIAIPSSVKRIGMATFAFCNSLTGVTIPRGVTSIGKSAFEHCGSLTSINIPDGVTSIDEYAFFGCKNLTSVTIPDSVSSIGKEAFKNTPWIDSFGEFAVVNGMLFNYNGIAQDIVIPNNVTNISKEVFQSRTTLGSVILPDGVTNIGESAFMQCFSLTSINIPESVTRIGKEAFKSCDKLQPNFCHLNPELKVEAGALSNKCFSKIPFNQRIELLKYMTDTDCKEYIGDKNQWNELSPDQQVMLFLPHQGKAIQKIYQSFITAKSADAFCEALCQAITNASTANDCKAAAFFLTNFHDITSAENLQVLYSKLKGLKAASKSLTTVKKCKELVDKIKSAGNTNNADSAVNEYANALDSTGYSVAVVKATVKDYYSLEAKDLPKLKDMNGHEVPDYILPWLLVVHEKTVQRNYWDYNLDLATDFAPGLRPEAAAIVQKLNATVFQKALKKLSGYLGMSGKSKKMYLAFPLCRYANEELMVEMTGRAPGWRSSVSGNDAPALRSFREACKYSEYRCAIMFADRYHELDKYAAVRGLTEDDVRDMYLSDVGLDENGCKTYDLGNQIVNARLQSDLSFLVEVPDAAKPAKSLPKKGANVDKYEIANADFAELKKNTKAVVKSTVNHCFEDFLSGRTRDAESWKRAYINNPLLHHVAKLLVWTQGDATFTLTDNGIVCSNGAEYIITDKPIAVAHPVEMDASDLAAWREYYRAAGLKQPFEQVWEIPFDAKSVHEDRYEGTTIFYRRVMNMAKHGIHYVDEDFHNSVYFYTDDCDLESDINNPLRHEIASDATFTLGKFRFKKYTRKVNHIVYLFDKWTIKERITKDDVSVMELLSAYNAAQITEFLNESIDAKATNLTAALMEYKQEHFPEYDAFSEFTLD